MQRTIYLKSVKSPEDVRLLKPAADNKKLGGGRGIIQKGKWKGMMLYQLSLEERKTCPKSCAQWDNCYGNNMPFAHRIDHTHASFQTLLESELGTLAARHPGGFVVRLHVLGDFFSAGYVAFWKRALHRHRALHVYGYSHRWPEQGAIGRAIERLNGERCWIRFSDRGGRMSANVEGEGIPCPEQSGKTKSCLTCGLCWQTDRPIRFEKH